MIRINDIRSLALLAAFAAFGVPNLLACTQNVTDDTSTTQDEEVRRATMVDVSGGKDTKGSGGIGDVPATAAHPTSRLGPHPDPWQGGDGNPRGPHPDPWRSSGGDDGNGSNGTGSGASTGTGTGSSGKPGDPSNPNQ